MVIGAIPVADEKILICRRAIEPCLGKWTLPAGYLENGETIEECARRESMEEAFAELANMQPYVLINLSFINQVYFMYRADLVNRDYRPGTESLEVKMVSTAELPWDDLAFAVIREVLKIYIEDLRRGSFPFRVIDMDAPPKKKICV